MKPHHQPQRSNMIDGNKLRREAEAAVANRHAQPTEHVESLDEIVGFPDPDSNRRDGFRPSDSASSTHT